MDARQQLLALARGYAAARNLSLARVSTLANNQGRFFDRLAAGANFTIETYQKCLTWFEANWPEGTAWPDGVPRPEKAAA